MASQNYFTSFNKGQVIGVVIALIVFFGGGYWVGAATHAAPAGRTGAAGSFAGGAGGFTGGAGRGAAGSNRSGLSGAVTGSILSLDGNSMTITMGTGGTRIVYFASSTSILKTAMGTTADLSTGTNVVVAGTPAADGSVVAQSIQIRPAGMTTGYGGRGAASSTAGMPANMPMQPAQ